MVDSSDVAGANSMSDLLWARLSAAELVSGELPVDETGRRAPSPWPVRVMLGVAGWLGAIFLFGFAAITLHDFLRDASSAWPLGGLCLICAIGLFYAVPANGFAGQFAFALSVAGQFLVVMGMQNLAKEWAAFLMILIEAALAFAISNYVHRVFTAIAANTALVLWLGWTMHAPMLASGLLAIGVTLIWVDPIMIAKRQALWEPIGYGLAIGLLLIDGAWIFESNVWSRNSPVVTSFAHWVGPIVVGLTLVYVAWKLSAGTMLAVGAAAVIALCGVAAPGISAAVLVITLGFASAQRVLMGLGLVGFAFYLWHFYYQWDLTFLAKSMVLAATGVVLLGLRWVIGRVWADA
jgi:hypothetical protein